MMCPHLKPILVLFKIGTIGGTEATTLASLCEAVDARIASGADGTEAFTNMAADEAGAPHVPS